jgi:hypothetical protein
MKEMSRSEHIAEIDEWSVFVNKYWQKEPVVLHDMPLSNSEHVFDTVVLACSKYRNQATDAPFLKLYVNGKQITHNVQDFLPDARDRSARGYEQRLERELHAESFILFITGFERYSTTLYDRTQEFLSHIFKYTGIPAAHAELELFLGRYAYTPGGIHKEECTNFQWVIDGNKTMYTWPEASWNIETLEVHTQHDPTSLEEEYFLDDVRLDDCRSSSQALHGKAGDILYWPSRHWHVGETPELSIAITCALYMNGRPYNTIIETIQRIIEQKPDAQNIVSSYKTPSNVYTTFEDALPASLQQSLETIKDIVHSRQLQQELVEQWLKRASNLGLSRTLDLLPQRDFTDEESVYRIAPQPILYVKVDEQTLLYAANGHCTAVNARTEVVDLFDALNTGKPIPIRELLSRQSTAGVDKSPFDVYQIVVFLYRTRAIAVA